MNKKQLSERDICTKFITPSLRQAGWDEMTQLREEVSFTKGRIIVRGKLVTRGKAKRILADAKEYASQAKDYAVNAKDHARERAYAAEHAVEDQVKDHPLTTLAVVAGIGFAVGVLLRRR